MSTIPPNWLGSIIQTHGAQDRATEARSRERAADAERAGKEGFSERLQDVIENTDRDSQVYADAEGTGSQGRPFPEEPPAAPPGDQDPPEHSGPRLDVQA